MNYEFHAHYPFALKDSVTQGSAIRWLAEESSELPGRWRDLADIVDAVNRMDILVQATITGFGDRARGGTRKRPGGYKYWVEKSASEFIRTGLREMDALGLTPKVPDLSQLPPYSWALQFAFRLRTPYISRDDVVFHILDNPLKKEWVFKIPYIAPSQWKGALRSAMRTERGYGSLEDEAKDEQMCRLFGNVNSEDTTFSSGQLYFYPTYFDKMGLEVINPHDRERVVGVRGPILFECAPVGAQGVFTLLYVPRPSTDLSSDETVRMARDDMVAVTEGIRLMMTLYGIGAKTSSGYGLVDEVVERGILEIGVPEQQRVQYGSLHGLAESAREAGSTRGE